MSLPFQKKVGAHFLACVRKTLYRKKAELPSFLIGSMYDIFTYIWLIFMVNVGKYTILDGMGSLVNGFFSPSKFAKYSSVFVLLGKCKPSGNASVGDPEGPRRIEIPKLMCKRSENDLPGFGGYYKSTIYSWRKHLQRYVASLQMSCGIVLPFDTKKTLYSRSTLA